MSEYLSDTKDSACISTSTDKDKNESMISLKKEEEEEVEFNKELKFMIFENFQFDCVRDNKKEFMNLFCNDPYTFCVLLNPRFVDDEKKLNTIRRIVENEKPAHTVGKVMLLQPWFYLGMHTYLGINTQLNEETFAVGKSTIGRDTISGTLDITNNNTKMDGVYTIGHG